VADAFQVGYTKQYFQEWGQTLHGDQSLSVPPTDKLQPLLRAEALAEPYAFDASQLAAVQVSQTPAFTKDLKDFTRDDISARQKLKQMLRMYDDTRSALERRKDVGQLFVNTQTGSPRELDNKIVSYLVLGNSPTRLGAQITLPEQEADDRPLLTLLGLIRIIAEHTLDEQFELPWLAEDNSEEAKRYKTWETKAGEAGDTVGGALGRAVAVGIASVLNPFLKLPDEFSLGVSYFTGVMVRKGAELQMHRYLEEHSEMGRARVAG
jgi:hypothetical protein